jgi:choline dehydrogenase-like flavoprotein
MHIDDLACLGDGSTIETDLLIVGGGPAGLAIAHEFRDSSIKVLITESGRLTEEPDHSALNGVESIGEPRTEAQKQKRSQFHATSSVSWSGDVQQFGARCRALGGSTHAWAGKSAALDDIDFAGRAWVPYSGWPFKRSELSRYLDRAAEILNLGPNRYDDSLWKLIGTPTPSPALDPKLLRSFFWQFSRSRIDQFDVMRFGAEFLGLKARNLRVLINATVTRLDTDPDGRAFQSAEVSTIDGARTRIFARSAVLAAGGIENPRLLMASASQRHPAGLGNRYDVVGRFLQDHPSARIGRFTAEDCKPVIQRFGFYGVRHERRTHMYMHGLTLSPALQERERLLNCALYMLEERAPDDPWDALKRLLQARTTQPFADLMAVAKSPGLLAKGTAMRVLESNAVPDSVKQMVVDATIRLKPGFVAREFHSRGLPHKLIGLSVDAITEQQPDPESRVTLSDRRDALGVPLPRVNWRIDDMARRSLVRMGNLIAAEFPRAGLPAPILEDWVANDRPEEAVIIDMAHNLGTTRMSDDPRSGVVDPRCRVHGISGLYVAGGSVFPTSGHANPTLTIVALAVRLADQLRADLAPRVSHTPPTSMLPSDRPMSWTGKNTNGPG